MLVIQSLLGRLRSVGRGEEGAALVAVVGVFMVGFIVAVMIAGMSIFAIQQNQKSTVSLQAFTAAESGRDAVVKRLTVSVSDCSTTVPYTSTNPLDPAYSAVVYALAADPATTPPDLSTRSCPSKTSKYILIKSTGTAGSASVTVNSVYKWLPTVVTTPSNGLGYNGTGMAVWLTSYTGDVILRSGNFDCGGSIFGIGASAIHGNLYVLNGNVDFGGGCTVDQSVYVNGSVSANLSLGNSLTIGGDLMATGDITANVSTGILGIGQGYMSIGGNVVTSATLAMNGKCSIAQSVYAGVATLSMTGSTVACTIGGSIVSSGTGNTLPTWSCALGCLVTTQDTALRVAGSVQAKGTWNLGTSTSGGRYYQGTTRKSPTQNVTTGLPSAPSWPYSPTDLTNRSAWVEIPNDPMLWTGFDVVKMGTSLFDCNALLNYGSLSDRIKTVSTQPLLIDATACGNPLSITLSSFYLGRDVAIMTSRGIAVGAVAFQSTTKGAARKLYLVQYDWTVDNPTAPTCKPASGTPDRTADRISFNVASMTSDVTTLLYSPCGIGGSLTTNLYGQMYAPTIGTQIATSFTCRRMTLEGLFDFTCSASDTSQVAGDGKLGTIVSQSEP